jgi:hypothetical protein
MDFWLPRQILVHDRPRSTQPVEEPSMKVSNTRINVSSTAIVQRLAVALACVLIAITWTGIGHAADDSIRGLGHGRLDQVVPGYTGTRDLKILLPELENVPGAVLPIVELEISGRSAIRLSNPAETVPVSFNSGIAELRFLYSSGLQVSATIRSDQTTLTVPAVRKIAVSLLDHVGGAVAGATLTASGGSGLFSWRAELQSDMAGVVVLPYPDSAVTRAAIHVVAKGFAPFADDVELGSDRERRITLVAAARIVGTLSGAPGEHPEAALRLRRVTDGPTRRTVARGDFVLDGVDAGQYELDIVVSKRGSQRLHLSVSPGQDAYVGMIDISAGATWAAEFQHENGRPIQGARVRLLREGMSGTEAPEGVTDRNGRLMLSRVMPGEYEVEVFVKNQGWQKYPSEMVVTSPDARVPRVFRFLEADCSVRILFEGHPIGATIPYHVGLPVSDGGIRVEVRGDSREEYLASVPCTGIASVRRLEGDFSLHTTLLSAGESRIVVPYVEVGTRELQVLVAGKPLSGWQVWAVKRDSSETVVKEGVSNVTDDSGRTNVVMSSDRSMIVYLERSPTMLVISAAAFSQIPGGVQMDLPDRHFSGVARDEQGKALGGVYIGGHVVGVGDDSKLPTSAVTQFKAGEWVIQFTSVTETRLFASERIELEDSAKGVTRVDATLEREPRR